MAGARFLSVGSVMRSLLFFSKFNVSFCCGVRLEKGGLMLYFCVNASVICFFEKFQSIFCIRRSRWRGPAFQFNIEVGNVFGLFMIWIGVQVIVCSHSVCKFFHACLNVWRCFDGGCVEFPSKTKEVFGTWLWMYSVAEVVE